MFIQVGYGLEGALPDVTAFDITERHIKPLFRTGNYEAGLATGIDLILKAIRGEYKGSKKTVAERKGSGGVFGLLPFITFIIVLIIISRLFRKLGGYGYSSLRGAPVFILRGVFINLPSLATKPFTKNVAINSGNASRRQCIIAFVNKSLPMVLVKRSQS